jgi:hypothetical protein
VVFVPPELAVVPVVAFLELPHAAMAITAATASAA